MANIWKKLLMAILIICILFNIVIKLISRTNLKDQLRAVIGRESIFAFFDNKEEPGKDGSENNGSISGSTDYINGINNGQTSSTQVNGQTNINSQTNGQSGESGQSVSEAVENIAGNVITNVGEKINDAAHNVADSQNKVIDKGTKTGEELKKGYDESIGTWPQQIGNIIQSYGF